MGGVATGLDGRSSLPGLYAVGESSCTGLHGANRLASNSLAECFVFGHRAAHAALDETNVSSVASHISPPKAGPSVVPSPETRAALWRLAGIRRTQDGLEQLLDDPFPLARLIARAALTRQESRGAHQRGDFPVPDSGCDHMHLVVDIEGAASWEVWH
jgi:L-aspartate oxidase